MKQLVSILALASALCSSTSAQTEPLRVSDNGHFLVKADGEPVFLLADTAWSLVSRLKREEITEYLEHRKGQGFNAAAFVLYRPGKSDLGDATINAYGRMPFEITDDKPDPTKPSVTPETNSADGRAYDYWDHVDFAIAEMKRLDLYAIVLPCWGSTVAGDMVTGKATKDLAFNENSAREYGRWLGARYRDVPHILWMLGGDRSAVYEKTGADYRPVFRAMAEGLRTGGSTALMSFHPQKRGLQSGDWFHHDAWLSFNSIQLWPEVQIQAVTRDWQATPTKPTWLFEGRYEGYWKKGYKAEDWGEWQCRQQAWQTVFAGAFGHTYGHETVIGFGGDGRDWKPKLDAPGACSMTHLAKFMSSLTDEEFLSREPDQSLLVGDEGKAERLKSNRITAVRAADRKLMMFYNANGRSMRVKMDQLAAKKAAASWYNPRTGMWRVKDSETEARIPFASDIAAGPGAAVHTFDPPTSGDGQDWVLVLSAKQN